MNHAIRSPPARAFSSALDTVVRLLRMDCRAARSRP